MFLLTMVSCEAIHFPCIYIVFHNNSGKRKFNLFYELIVILNDIVF